MSRLLPFQSDTDVPEDRSPRVVDLDGEDAEKVFGALSSDTARQIYTSLHDEPRTASDIADAVDSSIQNVRYHLDSLADAGLVEVVDTWYSSRGNEMKVYAPKDGPLIVSSDESRASRLRTALNRLVGGIGVLAAASLLIQYGSREFLSMLGSGDSAQPTSRDGGAGGGDAGDAGDGGDGGDAGDVAAEPEYMQENASETEAGGDDGGVEIQDAETTSKDGGDATVSDGGTETVSEQTVTEQARVEQTTREETVEEAAATTRRGTETVAEDGGGADFTTEATETLTRTVTDTAAEGGGSGLLEGGLPPGALFFLGGLVVLLVLVTYQYRSAPYR